MKKVLYLVALSIFVFACTKQIKEENEGPRANGFIPSGYLEKIKGYLKDSLSAEDYNNIDFSLGSISKQQSSWFLRLAWLHKRLERDFLLLQTDNLGNCNEGRIVHLDKDTGSDQSVFNGNISVQFLNRGLIVSSAVTNGSILELHPQLFSGIITNSSIAEPLLIPAPVYQQLPEVVVVGYIPASGGGLSYGELMSFEAMLNLGGGYGYSSGGTGSGSSGGGSGSGTGSGNSGVYSPIGGGGGGGIQPSQAVTINYETSTGLPAINVPSYLNCFSAIPDAGSQCSVTIYTDLPVNDDPTMIFNFNTGAVGHSFLKLTKSGSGQSISQVIGFTATRPFQAMIAPGAVPSKMVDNHGHKFNASLTMIITPAQLRTEIATIESLSGTPYDIVNFNCVSYSVTVMNAIRTGSPLEVPPMIQPGTMPLSSTPEGLYVLLSRMKAAGGTDAPNIVTDEVMFAGNSHGACN